MTTPTHIPRTALNPAARRLWRRVAAACLGAMMLTGCALELQNRQAAQEVAREAQPPGSTYVGWRVFQNKCAGCHGSDASGTANGPNLLARVRDMDSRRFVSHVLKRYDWSQLGNQPRSDGAALDAMVDSIIRRQDYPLNMPAMDGEPSVNAHLVDLHAYLSARAYGTQGPGRPER